MHEKQFVTTASDKSIDQRLRALGITLPAGVTPGGNYLPAVQTGKLLFLSGHTSRAVRGKLGMDLTTEQGYEAAKQVAIALLGTIHDAIGNLEHVQRIVKLLGMVNSTKDYTEQPRVINGASDLLVEVFAERGRHARSAVGMAQLPGNVAVEIELIVEIAAQS